MKNPFGTRAHFYTLLTGVCALCQADSPDSQKVRSASQLRQAEAAKDAKRRLNKDKKRIAELDTIIKKLYESFAVGRITDERFDSLLADYEAEQKTLQASVTEAEEKCNGHFIRVKVLKWPVLKHIQAVMGYILRHEDYFRTIMEEQLRVESYEQIRIRRKRLESNERRIAELKRLFIKIYEDNASGRLTDERYDMLSQTYEAEQKQLEAEAITLQQEIEVQERQNENIEKFIQTAHKYVGIDELDGYALRELVSAIYVDAPDKSSGKRVQHIHIKYDGLGFIPLNELMKEETA